MKYIAKLTADQFSKELQRELKLQEQYYLLILPKNILEKLGLASAELVFDLAVGNDDKLTLLGPKLGSQPKSVTSNLERGGFVI